LLLVDDDALLRRSLGFNLERAGYRVTTAARAEDALAVAVRQPPDLVLLDIGLPGMNGLDALGRFREQMGVPTILLTARRRELDEVLGLELGADDYVAKPFDLDVLLARIKAVLRRSQGSPKDHSKPLPIAVGELAIDPAAHSVTLGGLPLDLPRRQFDLLYALALDAGRVVSVDDLLSRVWGPEFQGQPEVVYVHIRWLRERLEREGQHSVRILTFRGVGYKLEVQGSPHPAFPQAGGF